MAEDINPDECRVKGLLKKITGYETRHNTTVGPSGHAVCDTRITTHFEVFSDDGNTIPIHFQSYVGLELINKRITYISNGETIQDNVLTAAGNRIARQDTTRQELIPDDVNLPKYLAVCCNYQG